MKIQRMTWTQLAERLSVSEPPPLLLPLGAIEAHGPHLPLDTDTILAERLAAEAINVLREEHKVEAFQAPCVPVSCAGWAASFPGTVSLSQAGARAVLKDAVAAMFKTGAKRMALVNLHFDPEHLTVVREVVADLRKAGHSGLLFPDFTRRETAKKIGGEFATGSCHGGSFETSLMLAGDADLVQPVFRSLPRLDVDLPAAARAGRKSFKEVGMDKAYCGDPASATPEEGRRLYRQLAQLLVDEALAAWK